MKRILFVLMFLLCFTGAFAVVYDAIFYVSADTYTNAGNTPTDISGNFVNITNTGVTLNTAGKLLEGLTGFSTSNYITSTSTAFQFQRTSPYSISAWVKRTSSPTSDHTIISQSSQDPNYPGWRVNINSAGHLNVELASSIATNWIGITGATTAFPTQDQWYFLVVTYDGSSSASGFKAYIDGSNYALSTVNANSLSSAINYADASFTLGARDNDIAPWIGALDEIAIYDKNLTGNDVAMLYNDGDGFNPYYTAPSTNLTLDYYGALGSYVRNLTYAYVLNFCVDDVIESLYIDGSLARTANMSCDDSGLYNPTTEGSFDIDILFDYTARDNVTQNLTPYSTVTVGTNVYKNYSTTTFGLTDAFGSADYSTCAENPLQTWWAPADLGVSSYYCWDGSAWDDLGNIQGVPNGYSLHAQSASTGNTTFIADLINPTAQLTVSAPIGYNTSTSPELTITSRCIDNVAPTPNYFLNYTSTLLNSSIANNTLITNNTVVVSGDNFVTLQCSDGFGTVTNSSVANYYVKLIRLWNEKLNIPFDINLVTGARVYFGENTTGYDLKANNRNNITVVSGDVNKVRVEYNNSANDLIFRQFDLSLFEDVTILEVCANGDDQSHKEQIVVSATEKEVKIQNTFSNCYVLGDYTRFAYQEALSATAYTIDSLYYVRLAGNDILASIDGSRATFINLDALIFQRNRNTIITNYDNVQVYPTGQENQTEIYYYNSQEDNQNVTLTITRLDTSEVVFTTSTFSDVNEFAVIYDWTSLVGVNASTLFKAEIDIVKTTGVEINLQTYFTTAGSSGSFQPAFAIALAIALLIGGLSLLGIGATFGWFGLFIGLMAIIVLSLAPLTIPVKFVTALVAIILLFIGSLVFTKYSNNLT